MCRIAGIVSNNACNLEQNIRKMTGVMHRGGPDNEGILIDENLNFALGHRRLSIIDLSEQGNQPMAYLNDKYLISFNGEIYNYLELKQELLSLGYQFDNNTDTEVILAGYDAWKEELFPRLEGMFAFLLIDREKNSLIAVRDFIGIKPLYLGKKGDDYFFSSEVKAFQAVYPDWEINTDWPIWFLTFGFLPEPVTTLKNVQSVPKGTFIEINLTDHSLVQKSWYTPKLNCSSIKDPEEAIRQTRDLVEKAIKKHLIADVEVGLFLSGGVDSSILTLITAKLLGSKVKTLSIDFDDDVFSERKYQDLIIQKAQTNHQFFKVSEQHFIDDWEQILASLDQPTTDAINSHFICKYAHKAGLKVVLSGLGADEIFGGYASFQRTDMFRKLHRLSILFHGLPVSWLGSYPQKKFEFLKKNIESSEYLLFRGLFTPSDVAAILNITVQKVWSVISQFTLPGYISELGFTTSKVSLLETEVYMLNQLLKDSDVQSMWYGLELRVPFLDKKLVEFVRSLPDAIKYPSSRPKFLLIEAFRDILPEEIWNRKKQGFTFPFDIWMKRMEIFKNKWLVPDSYYHKFTNNKINANRLWAIYLTKSIGTLKEFDKGSIVNDPAILFTFLSAFNNTGGIEKMNKIIMHCLSPQYGVLCEAYSLHDTNMDYRYFPQFYFKGFSGGKTKYLFQLLSKANQWNHVIVGHLNLAFIIWLMRLRNPSLKIWAITHGVEAWHTQKWFKKWLLKKADLLLSVSEFTKKELVRNNNIEADKIQVLHNCLDPFFYLPVLNKKPTYLIKRYAIPHGYKVLFTLTRMNSYESYKGYDHVLKALKIYVKEGNTQFKYILAGKADAIELNRIVTMIKDFQLEDYVILAGFIPEDELQDHYQMSDLFIMPSKKEGFGIVFIEAAVCGTSVIAGNCDGSIEALLNGELGKLVDPDNIGELLTQIKQSLQHPVDAVNQQKLAQEFYQFKAYQQKFSNLLNVK